MRTRAAVAVSIPLFLLCACGQSERDNDSMGTKQIYSLCPKTSDSRERLYEQVRSFADQQKAQLIDRGFEAQQELSEMKSGVLKSTGGKIILMTVDKPNKFRISVTNLGLEEKVALAVRTWAESGEDNPVAGFVNDLDRFWAIERVEGSVANDPPC